MGLYIFYEGWLDFLTLFITLFPTSGANTFFTSSNFNGIIGRGNTFKLWKQCVCVIALCKTINNSENCIVYFDDYCATIKLFFYLKENFNIYSLGTLRSNKIEGFPLISDKELKKDREQHDVKSIDDKFIVVKQADSKCVLVRSTIYEVTATRTVLRYCKEKTDSVPIPNSRV